MLQNLLHPNRHKLAFAGGLVIVLALTGLGVLANSLAVRQTKIEHTVKLQRVEVQQLLCEHPKTKSCEKHAYNLIVSCIAVPTCRKLLNLASTTPASTPIAAPTSSEVFEPEPEGGGPQPSPGHQQPGGSEPPPGPSHHPHPGNPTPAPTPAPAPAPSPAPIVVSPPPPLPAPAETPPSLKVCAQLPAIKKCVEAGLNGVVVE